MGRLARKTGEDNIRAMHKDLDRARQRQGSLQQAAEQFTGPSPRPAVRTTPHVVRQVTGRWTRSLVFAIGSWPRKSSKAGGYLGVYCRDLPRTRSSSAPPVVLEEIMPVSPFWADEVSETLFG